MDSLLGTRVTVSGESDAFRGDVQGLRAVAVVAVILFHIDRRWLPGGFVGVDVFFVISGFLIAGIILRKRWAGTFSLCDFYVGRAMRILPAYLVLLAITSLVAAVILVSKDFGFFRNSVKSAIYFGSNGYFSKFGDYFAPTAHELPLLHTWSLAIEMQFYLMLPIVLMLFSPRLRSASLIAAVIVLVGYGAREVTLGHKQAAYFSLLVRIPEFLLGVGLAVFESSRKQERVRELIDRSANWIGFMGLFVLVASFWLISDDSVFPGVWMLVPCIGTVAVMGARNSLVSAALARPILVWIGGLSYSLYLWHWPILAFLRYVTESYDLSIYLFGAFVISLLVLSYVSWRWIEIPFRRRESGVLGSNWRITMLTVGVVIPLSISSRVNASIEEPLPVAYTRYAAEDEICHGRVVGDCVRGSRESALEPVLVLGDSHAAQLNIFFDTVGRINGQRFRVITASGCVTIPEFDVARLPEYLHADCRASLLSAKQYIARANTVVVAGMWQYQASSPAFIRAFQRFLADADLEGRSVIVLAQIPMLASNVLRLKRFEKLGIGHPALPHSEWLQANSVVRQIVSQHGSAKFIDYSGHQLFTNAPLFGGRLIYHDSHHLNEIGAEEYGKIAASVFRELSR